MVAEIQGLFDYNRWANRRMLEAVATASREELDRELGGSFPSLRATLVHLLSAEWVWLERWRGTSPTGFPEWDLSTLEALRSKWAEVEAGQREFVQSLTAPQLAADVRYRTLAGAQFIAPLWQLMMHLVNHSTYHRGQVTTLMRQLGRTPANTDLVAFHRELSNAP